MIIPTFSAHQVRALRRSLGLTQTQFGKRMGVTWVTVSRWENGWSIGLHNVLRLRDLLEARREARTPTLRYRLSR